jgi:hypothetical protein
VLQLGNEKVRSMSADDFLSLRERTEVRVDRSGLEVVTASAPPERSKATLILTFSLREKELIRRFGPRSQAGAWE